MTSINTINSSQSVLSSDSLSGLDSMTAIQLMLMQEYDSQLKDAGNQIKVVSQLKKAYRGEIQKLQALLYKPTVEKTGKENDKDGKYISLTPEEYDSIKTGKQYYYDPKSDQILQTDASTSANIKGEPTLKASTGFRWFKPVPTSYQVRKEDIERRIESMNEEKESLNEQSSQLSLQVQSLANMRKISLETASNCMSKQSEGLSTVARNIRS